MFVVDVHPVEIGRCERARVLQRHVLVAGAEGDLAQGQRLDHRIEVNGRLGERPADQRAKHGDTDGLGGDDRSRRA